MYQHSYNASWALVIGINNYEFAPPLGYARNDAEAIAEVLQCRFGFPCENVKVLLDGEATRDAIMAAFLRFANGVVDCDDRLLVFFAGHGHTHPGRRGEVGFLVPVDGNPPDLSTLIRWDELTRDGELIRAKHILYLMDACYGGLALTRHAPSGTMRFLKDMVRRYSRQVLTAGKADEVVADSGGPRAGHSVFTGHLLDALEGGASQGEGVLTANAVMAYVHDRVGKDQFSIQTPHFGYLDGDGDFVFDLRALASLDADPQTDEDLLVAAFPAAGYFEPEPDRSSVVGLAKEYLSEPRHRIKLHDLMFEVLRETLSHLGEDLFPLREPEVTPASVAERLKRYEEATFELRQLWTLVSTWGTGRDQVALLQRAAAQMAPQDPGPGKVVWIGLRWYPLMLMLYSGGIGALSQDNYPMLVSVLEARIGNQRTGQPTRTLLEAVADGWLTVIRSDIFKMLPGHERQYVPDKEHLFKVVQPVVEDLLYLGRQYEPLFDRLEVLTALAHDELRLEQDRRIWDPLGRFAWKFRNRSDVDPFTEVVREAGQAREEWEPIRAGLFRSYESFERVAEDFRKVLSRVGWP